MKNQISYSSKERAIRLVFKQQKGYESQSIISKIGCISETNRGIRGGMSTSDRERLKELEQENRELKMVNVILRKALAYFAQAELDRRSK